MPIYPGPDIATFVIGFQDTNTRVQWTNHSYWAAAGAQLTNANADAAALAFQTQVGALYKPLMAESVNIIGTRVRVFLSGSMVEGIAQGAGSGSADGTALPLYCSAIIRKVTGQFGRSHAGRYFIGGIAQFLATDGVLQSDGKASLKALADYIGADRTFGVPFHARHWCKKTNTFDAVQKCVGVDVLGTRRDRAKHVYANPI